MKKVEIRNMLESDIQSVAEIERMSFSLPWSENSFLSELHKTRSISKVAVLDDKLAGYICADYVLDEGHILTLAVHPYCRRMGIANTLVENILQELKSRACSVVYLEVRASNHLAERLYREFGFKIVGMRKKYYVSPIEDAVIMMLEVQ